MSRTLTREVTIARRAYRLDPDRVERMMNGILPEPILSHYVVVNQRRYPPSRSSQRSPGGPRRLQTHQARRILMNLGFAVGRRSAPPRGPGKPTRGEEPEGPLAETMRAFVGRWVAIAGDEVLVAADSPHEVVRWLARHRRMADSMFRVPDDEVAAAGLAPL